MEKELAAGVDPTRICFVSFTRKAANEAAERAATKFNFDSSSLRYFRTLHSLAYRQLRVGGHELMSKSDWETLGEMLGIDFSSFHVTEEGLPMGGEKGDKLRFIDGYARSRCIPVVDAWHEVAYEDIRKAEAIQFCETYKEYRERHSVMDYTDMIEQFIERGECLDIDVAFIDEASGYL
jgi:superfamily I DNA/RNA helicase